MNTYTDEQLAILKRLPFDPSTKYNMKVALEKHHPEVVKLVMEDTQFLATDASMRERVYCVLNGITSPVLCQHCHSKSVSFKTSIGEYGGYSPYCSISCGTKAQLQRQGHANFNNPEKARATRIARYGSYHKDDFAEKLKATKLSRHGDANWVNKEKAAETNMKRHGVKHWVNRDKMLRTKKDRYGDANFNNAEKISETKKAFTQEKIDLINEKRSATNLDLYGCEHPLQNSDVLKKAQGTCLERYGVDTVLRLSSTHAVANMAKRERAWVNIQRLATEYEPLFTKEEFLSKGSGEYYEWRHKPCGEVVRGRYSDGRIFAHCRKCYPYGSSIEEKEVADFIKGIYSGLVLENDREVLKPRDLDIYLPERELAFEYDGLFYHSTEHGAEPKHMLDKTTACLEKGIQLVHIFEDEWLSGKDIVKSRIRSLLGLSLKRIPARKCQVKDVEDSVARDFLSTCHIQGACPASVRLGLYFQDELMALMTFGKPRFNKKCDWELLRFCTALDTSVIGGAGKLLKAFEERFHPRALLSYADRRWSKGDLYERLGFTLEGCSQPNYWYTKGDCSERFSRLTFQKHMLKEKLGEVFDDGRTEAENMSAAGYRRVYDCGNLVFVKRYAVNEH